MFLQPRRIRWVSHFILFQLLRTRIFKSIWIIDWNQLGEESPCKMFVLCWNTIMVKARLHGDFRRTTTVDARGGIKLCRWLWICGRSNHFNMSGSLWRRDGDYAMPMIESHTRLLFEHEGGSRGAFHKCSANATSLPIPERDDGKHQNSILRWSCVPEALNSIDKHGVVIPFILNQNMNLKS